MLACSSSLSKQVADAWKEQLVPKTYSRTQELCSDPRPLFIGKQSSSVRKWSGAFGLLICSRTTTLMTACCLMHGTKWASTPHSTAFREHKVIVYTSRALRSLFLSTQNGIEEKCKQIRCFVLARGRRYSADRNPNEFLPKRPRVRKSLCKSSLHGRRAGNAWYIRKRGLSAPSQCCLQGQSRISWVLMNLIWGWRARALNRCFPGNFGWKSIKLNDS